MTMMEDRANSNPESERPNIRLDTEEIDGLAVAIQNGCEEDSDEHLGNLRKIHEAYDPYIISIAYQRAPKDKGHTGPEDLAQELHLYLAEILADKRYDPQQGRFHYYFQKCISGKVNHFFRDIVYRGQRVHYQLGRQVGGAAVRDMTWNEFASESKAQGYNERDARLAYLAVQYSSILSLDALASQSDDRSRSELGGYDEGVGDVEDKLECKDLLSKLSEREARILRMKFWDGFSQSQIGDSEGVTQMQISRLVRNALAQLGAIVDRYDDDRE